MYNTGSKDMIGRRNLVKRGIHISEGIKYASFIDDHSSRCVSDFERSI